MKNKKFIATVAALCLIVVAVAAAVVGVFAAAKQKTDTNISVKYIAKNVNATVTISSMYGGFHYVDNTPDDDTDPLTFSNDLRSSWTTALVNDGTTNTSSTSGYKFFPKDYTNTKTLSLEKVNLGWNNAEDDNQDGLEFANYAVYRFEFSNLGNQDFKITAKYSDIATDRLTGDEAPNFELHWFHGTNSNPTFVTNYDDDGSLASDNWFVSNNSNLTEIINADAVEEQGTEGDPDYVAPQDAITDLTDLNGVNGFEVIDSVKKYTGTETPKTYYVYLVVVVKDIEKDVNEYTIGTDADDRHLTFELEAVRPDLVQP